MDCPVADLDRQISESRIYEVVDNPDEDPVENSAENPDKRPQGDLDEALPCVILNPEQFYKN
jgi:hypothetical protein